MHPEPFCVGVVHTEPPRVIFELYQSFKELPTGRTPPDIEQLITAGATLDVSLGKGHGIEVYTVYVVMQRLPTHILVRELLATLWAMQEVRAVHRFGITGF